jgi:hypothetical protein
MGAFPESREFGNVTRIKGDEPDKRRVRERHED